MKIKKYRPSWAVNSLKKKKKYYLSINAESEHRKLVDKLARIIVS